jgi:hypothetical protein
MDSKVGTSKLSGWFSAIVTPAPVIGGARGKGAWGRGGGEIYRINEFGEDTNLENKRIWRINEFGE